MSKHLKSIVIPPWLTALFLAVMCLMIGIGIYIGLHSRVLGPDY